jgi:hypothetical protein
MNGGIEHALESLSREEITAAIAGFRFFAMPEAGRLFESGLNRGLEGGSEDADRRYAALIPDDGTIEAQFSAVLASSPSAFSPL